MSDADVTGIPLIVALQSHFNAWRASYGHLGARFCVDGLIGENEQAWLSSKPRILFLTKEANDRNGVMAASENDLPKLLRNSQDFPQNLKTFERNLGIWALGLQTHELGGPLSYKEAKLNIKGAGVALESFRRYESEEAARRGP